MRFWFARTDRAADPSLIPAVGYLRTLGLAYWLWGLLAGAFAIVLADVTFDTGLRGIVWATAITTPFMLWAIWHLIPRGRSLPEPPPALPVAPFSLSLRTLLEVSAFVIVVVVGVHLLGSIHDTNLALVPGGLFATGLVQLVAAGWIGLWQRRAGRRVLIGEQDEESRIFAVA